MMTLKSPILPKAKRPLERIAFAGPMCSGKTTLANHLVDQYMYTKFSFAGVLKDVTAKLYGIVSKDNYGRKMLQELADDLKKWDSNLFTTHLLLEIEDYYKQGYGQIVVDDLRFINEYDALKANGFTIIGVDCKEKERLNRIYRLYPDTDRGRLTHPSEEGWKTMTMDYWIDNTGPSGPLFLDGIVGGK